MPDQPASNRTEFPTARRLQKARDDGSVPQSAEFSSFATLFALVAAVTITAPWLMNWAAAIVKEGMSCKMGIFENTTIFVKFWNSLVVDSLIVSLPVIGAVCAAAVAAGLVIGGWNFSPLALAPKFDALNPAAGLEQMFNGRAVVTLLTSILKLLFVSIVAWFYLNSKIETISTLAWAESGQIVPVIGKIILGLCVRICIALLILALADVIYQKWKYIEELKMTLQEVKQERRDLEGSPEVKTHIRRIQIQMTMKRMLRDVPKANVVLVNPTHVAVALKYDAKTMDAPVMVAKGADHMAEKIMEIARAYGVPIVRRPALARTIFSTIEVGSAIPQDLYLAVAEVLALLHRLRRKKR